MTQKIKAPATRVWEVMATPGALALYHPFCASNPVSSWPGVGARDTIHYLSGVTLERRFTAWTDGEGYELEIGNARWPTNHVRWELVARSADESELTVTVFPGAFGAYPTVLRAALNQWYLIPLLRRYLRNVLRGLDHYLTTGQQVAPNQFGRLPLFSYLTRRPRRRVDAV